MRLGFVCGEYPPGRHGGIGTVLHRTAEALAARGHAVRVVVVDRGPFPVHQATPSRHGVEVTRVPEPPGPLGWVRARVAVWRVVRTWARRGGVELVEVPDWEGWAAGWPSLSVPVVARLHGSATVLARWQGGGAPAITRLLERLSLRRADAVSAASRFAADATRRAFDLPLAGAVALPNPVSGTPESADGGRSPGRVVFAGTLSAVKGVRELFAAWPRVLVAIPNAELHLFGHDTRRPDGRSELAALRAGLAPAAAARVHHHGFVDQARLTVALHEAAVVVVPSRVEAFGLVAAEAMQAGCAVVCGNTGGGSELITDGVNGLLVNAADPVALAGAVQRLLADPATRARLGRAARAHAISSLTLEALLPRQEEWYARTIGAWRGRAGGTAA